MQVQVPAKDGRGGRVRVRVTNYSVLESSIFIFEALGRNYLPPMHLLRQAQGRLFMLELVPQSTSLQPRG